VLAVMHEMEARRGMGDEVPLVVGEVGFWLVLSEILLLVFGVDTGWVASLPASRGNFTQGVFQCHHQIFISGNGFVGLFKQRTAKSATVRCLLEAQSQFWWHTGAKLELGCNLCVPMLFGHSGWRDLGAQKHTTRAS
jgi:hypothetical protein